jgi:ABC-type multidrug transport system fused ATPase/permease subunit
VKDLHFLREYRSQIALVSQEPVLYTGTIRENIVMGIESEEGDVGEDSVEQVCRDANIWEFIVSLLIFFAQNLSADGNSRLFPKVSIPS